MTNPLERIESHPHEAKRLLALNTNIFSISRFSRTKHLEKQAKN